MELQDEAKCLPEAASAISITRMLRALEQIRRMRGGAQSHLMRCDDGYYYVVKFQNNPQHTRVLVNELLGTRLAARLGCPPYRWRSLPSPKN
jgi:hypothetical protein